MREPEIPPFPSPEKCVNASCQGQMHLGREKSEHAVGGGSRERDARARTYTLMPWWRNHVQYSRIYLRSAAYARAGIKDLALLFYLT